MADAMKLVPVEPTLAMIEAAVAGIERAQKQGYHGLSPLSVYRAMLAASPPAREEAPAEGAGENLRAMLRNVVAHATGGSVLNGDELGLNDICCQITAMRNKIYLAGQERPRTSEPAGCYDCATDRPHTTTDFCNPATATADKLRVAKEALEHYAAGGYVKAKEALVKIEALS